MNEIELPEAPSVMKKGKRSKGSNIMSAAASDDDNTSNDQNKRISSKMPYQGKLENNRNIRNMAKS